MPDATLKYPTYEALAKAFATGELDKNKYVLVLDNDCCSLDYRGDDADDEEAQNEAYERCQKLFHGGGYADLGDAVRAAGIPCEWC